MRILHILSAVTLAGGALTWKFGLAPATAPLAEETRGKVGDAIARAWRPFVLSGILGLLVSGTYNVMRKTNLPPAYHPLFGVKVLLALHVFAVLWMVTKPGNRKRERQLSGVVFSAVAIVAISAALRWLTV